MSISTIVTVVVLTVVSLFLSFESNSLCTVKIGDSVLKGKIRKTWSGKYYCSFYGIPYAIQPKRFETATLSDIDWSGLKDFSSESEKCYQYDYNQMDFIGKEDCLYLDIHTDLESSDAPVFVWIHGGTFNFGSGQEDVVRPDGLIDRGIVTVTINYRLGPLGFFSHPHSNVSKNLGLRDQVVALNWIKSHILYFGGDNNNVTLAGWSAGSAAVTYHIYSELSRGLFQKAIAMSGSLTNPWAFNIKSIESSISWCNYFNIDCSNSNSLQQLQQGEVDVLQYYTSGICCTFFNVPYPSFVPTKEEAIQDSDKMMVWEEPHKIIATKPINDVPLLVGYTSLEESCDVHFTDKVQMRKFNFPHNNSDVHTFLHEFLGYKKFDEEKNRKFIKMRRIADLIHGIRYFADRYSENADSPLYMYIFSLARRNRKRNRLCIINSEDGAFHGDDINLLFGQYFKVLQTFQRNVKKPQKDMWDLWANFIYHGDPTPSNVEAEGLPTWPPYKENKLVMDISETLSVRHQDSTELFTLWNLIYDCFYHANCDAFFKIKSHFLS